MTKYKGETRCQRLARKLGGTWIYSLVEHEWQRKEDGLIVQPRSCLSPRYDGDDDTFVTRYYRCDTQEEVYL